MPHGPDNPAAPHGFNALAAPGDPDTPGAPPGFNGPATISKFAAPGQFAGPAAAGHVTGLAGPGECAGETANPAAAGPGDGTDFSETVTGPDVPETATDPNITRTAGGPRAAEPADIPTRQSVDFAAAPVATSYPGPAPPDEDATIVYPADAAPGYRADAASAAADGWPPPGPPMAGGGPATDPNAIWDLAATDVFPVAPPQAPDDEAPGASFS
jgi:hypothetical protein